MAQTEQTKTQETGMKMRCPTCGAEYTSQEELDQHKHEAHPNE